MTRIIKNSSKLLLYLVNDMLDVYMLKNGKFQKIDDKIQFKAMMREIYEMFSLQTAAKCISFKINFTNSIPN